MSRNNAGVIAGAFLGGAILGGIVALLFAPKSGAETRSMIRDFVEDELEEAKRKARQAREYVDEEIDKYTKKARTAVEEIQEIAADVKECVNAERQKIAKG